MIDEDSSNSRDNLISNLNFLKRRRRSCCRFRTSLILFILLLLLIGTLLVSFYNYSTILSSSIFKLTESFKFLLNNNEQSSEWYLNMSAQGTESCIRLYDVDGDGLDDIIFGAAGSVLLPTINIYFLPSLKFE